MLRVILFGDTDDGDKLTPNEHEFERRPWAIIRDMWAGGVNLPWNLWLAGAIGLSFLFTRITLGAEGAMANADHLLGSLVITVLAVAAAEVTRVARFLLVPLGLAIVVAPFLYEGDTLHFMVSAVAGLAISALAFPRGRIVESYGSLDRVIR